MKELIIKPLDILGINAPWFSWLAAAVLVLWPAYEMIKLINLYRRQSNAIRKLTQDIIELRKKYPLRGSCGVNSQAIDRLHQLFANTPSVNGAWNCFRSKLIFRQLNHEDSEQVWQSDSAGVVFTEDTLLGNDFDKRQFHSVPGIVTGFGLLMTFIAILVGLWDVRIVGNKVTGLENLIGGLSGKFISSVAALMAATSFLILEKQFFHRLNIIRHTLIDAIDSLIPRRSDVHLLEEISLNIAEQTNAFRTFNSDLSQKLRNSFSESMGPTLERMVLAIEDLNQLTNSSKAELLETLKDMNQLLKHSEETKQDSITGQVEFLLRDLQKSLSDSINKMSTEFSQSLTGTAQTQFSRVAETVGATAEILEAMNSQFSDSQKALQELIILAKQSTENQFSNGSALIERMVGMIGETMVKMEVQLSEMSAKMTSTIEGTAERSAEAAGGIINEVRALNEQTVQKFLETLQKHEQQLDRVESLKKMLQDATAEFAEYVTGYNEINSDLKAVSRDTNTALQLLTQSTTSLKKAQELFNDVAKQTMEQTSLLVESNESQKELITETSKSQKELIDEIYDLMKDYSEIFSTVESSASRILENISDHLQSFTNATQNHFNATVTIANDHINSAVGQLATSIETLDDSLEDLTDIVNRIPKAR